MSTNLPPDPDKRDADARKARRTIVGFAFAAFLAATVTFGLVALLVSVFKHKQDRENTYLRFVNVDETTTDPAVWGQNWPRQYDGYLRTSDSSRTRYGGGEALPHQKLDSDPWLKILFSGYAFSLDYRDRRGHAYMLTDQLITERVLQRPQPGACLHCHASVVPTWRRVGAEALGQQSNQPNNPHDFNWPAVMKGFETMSTMKYVDARAELLKTPDGSPAGSPPNFGELNAPGSSTIRLPEGHPPVPGAVPGVAASAATKPTTQAVLTQQTGRAHPVSCVDCHDPKTMQLRVTRPGFVRGIQALAKSDDPVPHLPSVERWRKGNRGRPYDPNIDATRQEMRSFACGQCHVEYYCGPKDVLFFPWDNGLKVELIEKTFDARKFPDGSPFSDFTHGVTGAKIYKAQHPEFEMWSQGVHARSGVSCADCHMPYMRDGALKVSDHHVRSPLTMVSRSCQTCHPSPESELTARVDTIQARTRKLIDQSSTAYVDMIKAMTAAKAAGATPEQLKPALDLQRKSQWRLDFVYAENSMGFHASQEVARILAESIDFARQAQVIATTLRAPAAPTTTINAPPVEGVSAPTNTSVPVTIQTGPATQPAR